MPRCWAQPQLDTVPPTPWAVAPGCAWLHPAAGRASTLLLSAKWDFGGNRGSAWCDGQCCTVSLLNAAVTRSCLSSCIAAALPAFPNLPQHTRLINPSSRVLLGTCTEVQTYYGGLLIFLITTYFKTGSCFGGRGALTSSYFRLSNHRGFGVSKFQMNNVDPSTTQARRETFINPQEHTVTPCWLMIRPLRPLV